MGVEGEVSASSSSRTLSNFKGVGSLLTRSYVPGNHWAIMVSLMC